MRESGSPIWSFSANDLIPRDEYNFGSNGHVEEARWDLGLEPRQWAPPSNRRIYSENDWTPNANRGSERFIAVQLDQVTDMCIHGDAGIILFHQYKSALNSGSMAARIIAWPWQASPYDLRPEIGFTVGRGLVALAFDRQVLIVDLNKHARQQDGAIVRLVLPERPLSLTSEGSMPLGGNKHRSRSTHQW